MNLFGDVIKVNRYMPDMISITEAALETLLSTLPYEIIENSCRIGPPALKAICSRDEFWRKLLLRDYPGCNAPEQYTCVLDKSLSYRQNYKILRDRGVRQLPIVYKDNIVNVIWIQNSDLPSQILTDAQRMFAKKYPDLPRYLMYVMIPKQSRRDETGTYLLKYDTAIKTNVTFISAFDTAVSIQVNDYVVPFQEEKYPKLIGVIREPIEYPSIISIFQEWDETRPTSGRGSVVTLDILKDLVVSARPSKPSKIQLEPYDYSLKSIAENDLSQTIMNTDQGIYDRQEFVPGDFIGTEFTQKYPTWILGAGTIGVEYEGDYIFAAAEEPEGEPTEEQIEIGLGTPAFKYYVPVDADLVYNPISSYLQERRISRKKHMQPRSWFDLDEDNIGYSLVDNWTND